MFNRFLLPTSTPRISKIEPPLQREHDFSKNRISQLASIFDRFWCQFGSILPSKIHQNPLKNRFQDATIFWSIFASNFYRFLIDFGTQLGAMLATFSAQKGGRCESPPSFLLRYFFESIFFEILTHFGSILLHFGAKLAPFWLHVAAILVPSWRYLGPLGRTSWHWMGWWGYAEFRFTDRPRRVREAKRICFFYYLRPWDFS